MAHSFSELKNNRKNALTQVRAAAEKLAKGSERAVDQRFWSPTIDKDGNGSAIIRFLPASVGEEKPFVSYFSHAFQGPTGQWYIENSLTSIEKDDPVSIHNARLWRTGLESDKATARKQKRKQWFVSNVYVVRDPAKPETEGKVWLYKYGKKVFSMLNDALHPEFDDIEPIDPFDPWTGANFRLRIRKVDGFPNYDKSEFDSPSAIGTDKEIEDIWKRQYVLNEFVSPAFYKSYAELEARLNLVLGIGTPTSAPVTQAPAEEAPKHREIAETTTTVDDSDDELEAFRRALQEDDE